MFEAWEIQELKELAQISRLRSMGFDTDLLDEMKLDIEEDGHPDYMIGKDKQTLVWLGTVQWRMGIQDAQ